MDDINFNLCDIKLFIMQAIYFTTQIKVCVEIVDDSTVGSYSPSIICIQATPSSRTYRLLASVWQLHDVAALNSVAVALLALAELWTVFIVLDGVRELVWFRFLSFIYECDH